MVHHILTLDHRIPLPTGPNTDRDMLRNKLKTIDEIIEELDAETLKKVVLNKNVEKLVEHEALKRMCHESLDVLDEAALDIYCTLEEA